MSRKRTSLIWTCDKKLLQKFINSSSSYKEILAKIGMTNTEQGSHNRRLKQRILEDNLDTSILDQNRKLLRKSIISKIHNGNLLSDEMIFCKKSFVCRSIVKSRCIQNNLIPYCCNECNIQALWNNKPISLHLDHINGINNDNRLENLRFLCPNCHSQTSTYCGKKSKSKNTCSCGNLMHKNSNVCKKCNIKNNCPTKIFVNVDELYAILESVNWNFSAAGRKLGVSDNAIRKRCKKFNLI